MKEKNQATTLPAPLRTNVRAGDRWGGGDGWTCRQMAPRVLSDGTVAIEQICEKL